MQAELGKPNPLQPDRGKVAIHVDCSPTAAPVFEVVCFICSTSNMYVEVIWTPFSLLLIEELLY